MMVKKEIVIAMVLMALSGMVLAQDLGGTATQAMNARYATDAYPGFDSDAESLSPKRKEPKWFSFWFGPKRDNAIDQFKYCAELLQEEDYSKAARELDALVREWPTANEAVVAQEQYAELLLGKLGDTEEAFKEYRYLLDFYSLKCDYERIADKLYQIAGMLKEEGKEVMFIRFENTVDVRRAYESCVLHAPGAKWVPSAMLTIAKLREMDGIHEAAVKVYENLRNLYPDSDEAKLAIKHEAEVRMVILREHEYNRSRVKDTINFLTLAIANCRSADVEAIQGWLDEAKCLIEGEAYLAAKFYDSQMRTKRSAINAYERFLREYPDGKFAQLVQQRLAELKGAGK